MTQFRSIFFILIFFFFLKVEAKNYDGKSYVCADELGPLLEFSIPNFGDNLFEKKVPLKIYNKENRDLLYHSNGIIKKKTSAIDKSYFFYTVDFILNDDKSIQGYFEFFPPSNLMFKVEGSQFLNLVCWT